DDRHNSSGGLWSRGLPDNQYPARLPVFRWDACVSRPLADQCSLRRVNARNYAPAGRFSKTDRNFCQVDRIFPFGKDDFRHAAPDIPAEIEAGKIADPLKAEPFNRLCCGLKGDLPVTVPGQKIL